jgi:hypothetical protein
MNGKICMIAGSSTATERELTNAGDEKIVFNL